jgi:DNA-binding NarL/FixJ family response regulator
LCNELFRYALLCVWIQKLFGDFGVQIGGDRLGTLSVRVLMVDDFEPYRCLVASVLRKEPELQILCEVSDGLEAVQKAKELQPDLILLDIELPNLNGIEALSRIRQVSPNAKIIFLTQNSDKEVVAAAWITGAHGYVLKTDAGSELLTAVAAVLRGDEFISSGIKRG